MRMGRLIFAFVVRIWQKQVFLWHDSIDTCVKIQDSWTSSMFVAFPYGPCHVKTCLYHMRTTKMQISLCIHTVWSAPLFSLLKQCNTYTCYLQNSRTVASLCNWVGWFESYLVANPKTGFLVKRLILNSLVMIAVDCRVAVPTFPPPHTPLLHIPSPWKVLNGLGAKLRYKGYFASLLQPPGWKIWLLSWVRHMSWGLGNPCFTKLPVVIFL